MEKTLIHEDKQYKENIDIFLNQEDRDHGIAIPVAIGMRRKGIAIAKDKNFIYLINKDNIVFYKKERAGKDEYNYDYSYNIRRSLTGFYIVIHNGYICHTRPGKDDLFRFNSGVYRIFDEDGNAVGDKTNHPSHEECAVDKYPIEMGNGLVCYNNSFYELETLEKRFFVSPKFSIESIFKNGMFQLGFNYDDHRFIATVKDDKVIECVNIDNDENLYEIIQKYDDIAIFDYCYSRNNDNKEIKKRKYNLEAKLINLYCRRLKEFKQYCRNYRFIRLGYSEWEKEQFLVDRIITRQQFLENDFCLNNEEKKRLLDLRNLLRDDFHKYNKGRFIFRFAKSTNCSGIDCVLYSDFIILRTILYQSNCHDYRFINYNGESISDSTYTFISEVGSKNTFESYSFDFYNHKFIYNDRRTFGILEIQDGRIIDKVLPEILRPIKSELALEHSIKEDYIEELSFDGKKGLKKFFNYNGKEMDIKYVPMRIKEYIPGIIYDIHPRFDYFLEIDGPIIDAKMINGNLCLPCEDEFLACINEMRKKRKSLIHHNISEVRRIKTTYDEKEKECSLYFIKYHPIAFCDTNGSITLQNVGPELDFLMKNI